MKIKSRKNNKRFSQKANLGYEALEAKQLLAGDLTFGAEPTQIIDGLGREITSPAVGEQMQIELTYSTIDLDAGAEYRISAEYNGFTLESEILTAGAGGSTNQFETHTHTFEGWYTIDSPEDITFTLDSQNQIAESDETDNTTVRTIDPNKVEQSTLGTAILDLDTVTSTLEINDSGLVDDLNLELNILHTFDADLDVFLTSPAGTTVELFTNVGGGGDNFIGTTLDDEASTNIVDGAAPFTGSFRPEGFLSFFDGESITGTWTLEVTDDAAGDTGTLFSWGINAETSSDFNSPLSWPVGAEAFTEIGVGGYVDVDPNPSVFGRADFNGRDATSPGSDGMLINVIGLSTVDEGVEILAAAAGTISEVHDGENDRHYSTNTGPANFIVIDHGDGWQTTYTHLRRDSIQVNVGDAVGQGDMIALMGSGNEFFGNTGINFKLTHHGRPVESMIAPDVYQSSGEFQYVFDAEPAVYALTLGNQGGSIAAEGQSSAATFKLADQVSFGYSIGSLENGDVVVERFIDPAGNVAHSGGFTFSFDSPLGHDGESFVVNQVGTWKAEVLVNDVLLNSTEFEVTAEGAPEIRIDHGTGSSIFTHVRDGRHTPIDFGSSSPDDPNVEKVFTVTNHGGQDLDISGIEVPRGFIVVEGLSSTLAPGATDDFTIALDANELATTLGQVRVLSNDADEAIYNFPVEGRIEAGLRVDFGISQNSAAEGEGLLGNLVRTGDLSSAATFNLIAQGGASKVTIPAQVTIPAGESTVRFPITVNHDFDFDGDQQIDLIAESAVYQETRAELTTEDNDDRFETGGDSNNTFAGATDLGVLGRISEPGLDITNGDLQDEDFFTFEANATGEATVDLTFLDALGDIDLFAFDSAENELTNSRSSSDNESVTFNVVVGESYFVQVEGFNGDENQYDMSIRVDDRFDSAGASNQTFATATDLGVAGSISEPGLSLTNRGDEFADRDFDFFTFEADITGEATVDLTFLHALGDIELLVFNSQEEAGFIASSTSSDDNESLTFDVVAGESYFVEVEGHLGAENAYDLSIRVDDRFDSAGASNQTFATATDLGVLGRITESGLSITNRGEAVADLDVDHFKFEANATGEATVDLTFLHALGDVDLVIFDSSETMIAASTSIIDNESATFDVVAGESYFVQAIGSELEENAYDMSIRVDDRFDSAGASNRTFATATDLGVLGSISESGLSITHLGDEIADRNNDFFRFEADITGEATVDLTFLHANGDLDLTAFNSSGGASITDSRSFTDNESVTFDVIAGQSYVIFAEGFDGAENAYDMSIEVVAPFVLGDANLDGTVDFLDIAPFISLLTNNTFLREADIDGSSVVDFLDIAPFITLLAGGSLSESSQPIVVAPPVSSAASLVVSAEAESIAPVASTDEVPVATETSLVQTATADPEPARPIVTAVEPDPQASLVLVNNSLASPVDEVTQASVVAANVAEAASVETATAPVASATPIDTFVGPVAIAPVKYSFVGARDSSLRGSESNGPLAKRRSLKGNAERLDLSRDKHRSAHVSTKERFSTAAELFDAHPESLDNVFDFELEETFAGLIE